MKNVLRGRAVLALSMLLAAGIGIASFSGIFIQSTYENEALSYAVQGMGQDAVNLFLIIPVFIVSSIMMFRGSRRAAYVWSGALFYTVYSYAIYAFALHFNFLFLVYCMVFGLSFYLFAIFISSAMKRHTDREITPDKPVSIFLLVIAGVFYLLWLKEIVPALISGKTPQSIIDAGLMSNPVHVLDLAICLPGLIITAILLLKGRKWGYVLAPAMLVFCVLMTLAIAGMVVVMIIKHIETDMVLAVITGCISLASIFFLVKLLKNPYLP